MEKVLDDLYKEIRKARMTGLDMDLAEHCHDLIAAELKRSNCKECRFKKLYEGISMMCDDDKEIRIKRRTDKE